MHLSEYVIIERKKNCLCNIKTVIFFVVKQLSLSSRH